MDRQLINELVESRMQAIAVQQEQLVEAWSPYVSAVDEFLQQTQDREITEYEARNVAQCLENALAEAGIRSRARLFEATTEDNIAFLGIQLPVIAALLPSLCLNELGVTQALDRRIGAVFFMDVTYGSSKGDVTLGDTMISARTGHSRTENQRRYASTMVAGEAISGSGGASSVVTGTLAYAPGVNVTNGTIVIKQADGTVIGIDASTPGTVNGVNVTGTILASGAYSLTPASSWDSDGITIDYEYQYDKPTDSNGNYDGVPEADISITQETITALDFPLRTKYSLGASIDVQKAHGINLENELVKFLGGEVRFAIDQFGIDMIDRASIDGVLVDGTLQTPAEAITTWNATIGSGQEWVWKKHEILDRFEEGDMNIITKTLRGRASWIIGGNNVIRVIKQLPGDKFVPAANLSKTPVTGPVKVGTLDGKVVIHNPLLPTRVSGGSTITGPNRYIMGFKGDNFLTASFVYAPYIPLFATPTLVTNDLFAQKGFLSSAGFKIINCGMFTHGAVSNVGVQG